MMAAPRNVTVEVGRQRDVESAKEDSPTSKKPLGARLEARFPLTQWELVAATSVFLIFSVGLICIYSTMPPADYDKILRLPRTISDLRILRWVLDKSPSFYLGWLELFVETRNGF